MKPTILITGTVTKTAKRPFVNRVVLEDADGWIYIVDLREPKPKGVRKGSPATIAAKRTTSGETTTCAVDGLFESFGKRGKAARSCEKNGPPISRMPGR